MQQVNKIKPFKEEYTNVTDTDTPNNTHLYKNRSTRYSTADKKTKGHYSSKIGNIYNSIFFSIHTFRSLNCDS